MTKKEKNIVLGVTGSIAIYKSCDLVRRMKECGFNVHVVMTAEAQELIRPIVFQSLSGMRVYSGGLFDAQDGWEIGHVALANKADLILVAPATANIIAKFASGICDDLLTCTVCASKAKVLVAPAMNENMYRHKITQENIARLKSCGFYFIPPRKGLLACGLEGMGCLADTDEIVKEVKKFI
ncbi:MAG: flavoprotein [Candidatus Omnitrophica bacterium]|nr:flavoprotein [Candidatus Omnitrophota bacterium]